MDALTQEFLVACEIHSVARLRAVLDAGFDVRAPIAGVSPVTTLVEMYYRSDAFPTCLALLLAAGGTLDDPVLAPVLLNDPDALRAALEDDPTLVHHRTSLRCAFTPLEGVTLLHVAAEYGHRAVAEVLLAHGADVDARARLDGDGLNGHTPIFHTVNSNANRSAPLMTLLLAHGARPDVRATRHHVGARILVGDHLLRCHAHCIHAARRAAAVPAERDRARCQRSGAPRRRRSVYPG